MEKKDESKGQYILAKRLFTEVQSILTIGKLDAEEFNTTLANYYELGRKQPPKDCLNKTILFLLKFQRKTFIIRRDVICNINNKEYQVCKSY